MRLKKGALLASFVALAWASFGSAEEAARHWRLKGTGTLPAGRPKANAALAPKAWGVGTSYLRVGAGEFILTDSAPYSNTMFTTSGTTSRVYGLTPEAFFVASPKLPAGAKLLDVLINGCSGEDDGLFGYLYKCDYVGDNCELLLNMNATAGCGSDAYDLESLNFVVENRPGSDQLWIIVGTTATDGTDSFASATFAYQQQVSPAPQVASFLDVPTSDFGFQYVEALKASGITGGCGAGLFCPDGPVTRRQVAIFIAKALGLHWE